MKSNSRSVLALVPARGGSKSVPRKNLVRVNGRPLIEYTLRAAREAKGIDQIWLSSDDEEILLFGQSLGVTPLRRPKEFATDEASAVDVVRHFLASIPGELRERDPLVVYLQPTSPLRTAKHIEQALEQIASSEATCLMSVVQMSKSPFKSFRLDDSGKLQSLFDERLSNTRRQDLPSTFMPNGAIYIFAASDFTARGGFPSNGSIPFVMTESESIDVDTLADIVAVEQLLGERHA